MNLLIYSVPAVLCIMDTVYLRATILIYASHIAQRIKLLIFSQRLTAKDLTTPHLNALYDLCTRTYIDAIIQLGRSESVSIQDYYESNAV